MDGLLGCNCTVPVELGSSFGVERAASASVSDLALDGRAKQTWPRFTLRLSMIAVLDTLTFPHLRSILNPFSRGPYVGPSVEYKSPIWVKGSSRSLGE